MARFTAKISAAKAEDRLLFLKQEIPKELQGAIDALETRAELIFQAYAPRGKYSLGKIRDSIRAESGQSTASAGSFGRRFSSQRAFSVTAQARGRTGYDYVGVSRFGHREDRIEPTSGSFLQISGRFGWVGKWRGPSVAGYHPERDWADDASRVMVVEADLVSRELARALES